MTIPKNPFVSFNGKEIPIKPGSFKFSTSTDPSKVQMPSADTLREQLASFTMEMKVVPVLPRVIISEYAVRLVVDYSACRSPSRARRRHSRGIVGRVVERFEPCAYKMDGALYMHPKIAEQIGRERERRAEQMMFYSLRGGV